MSFLFIPSLKDAFLLTIARYRVTVCFSLQPLDY